MPQSSKSAKDIFLLASDAVLSDRPALLDAECGQDAALRRQVEALLKVHDQPDSILDKSRIDVGISPETPQGVSPTVTQAISEKPGQQIGPYKLLQPIGEGGMGSVWMAEQHEPVRRRVAIKLVKAGMDSRQVLARFQAERQALSMMDHPNIAKVLDAGTTEVNRPYFVMELVKGQPITTYCDERHLNPRERLELFLPVCHAIQHAHQKGIIHRDIKPSNVLVAEYDGRPVAKVIDFGVAKAVHQPLTEKTMFTGLGQIIGTLEYMSPEQARVNQLDIDTRSDVYSLGVLLYELLTGSTPFDKQRMRDAALDELLRIIREEEPPRPSIKLSGSATLPSIAVNRRTEPARLSVLVRGELDWIVMKAMEKDRNRRYETANGFAMDIQRYLSDEAVLACPPSAGYRFRKFARKNKVLFATTALVSAALFLGLIGMTWQAIRATRAEQLARANAERAVASQQEALAERDEKELARREALSERDAKEIARREAEESFLRSRQVVDEFFTLVSENDLFEIPGMQPVRIELLERARKYYEEMEASRPDDPDIMVGSAVAMLRLAYCSFDNSRGEDLLRFSIQGLNKVDEILQRFPDNHAAHHKLGGHWQGTRRIEQQTSPPSDWELARSTVARFINTWETLSAQSPDVDGFLNDLGMIYLIAGELEGALHALALSDDRDTILGLYRKSLAFWEKLVSRNPTSRFYVRQMLDCYNKYWVWLDHSGSHDEARKVSERLRVVQDQALNDFPELKLELAQEGQYIEQSELKRSAWQYHSQGDRNAAVAEFLRALDVLNLSVEQNLALSNFGFNQTETLNALLSILDSDSRNQLVKPTEAALKYCRKRLDTWPEVYTMRREVVMLLIFRAKLAFKLGEESEVQSCLTEAINLIDGYRFPPADSQRGRDERFDFCLDLRDLAANFGGNHYADLRTEALQRELELLQSMADENYPDSARTLERLGNLLAELGRKDEALAIYARRLEVNPRHLWSWIHLGNLQWDLGQRAEAIASYTSATEILPHEAAGWANRGLRYSQLRQFDKAIEDLSHGIELNANDPGYWHWRGDAYRESGQHAKAIEDYSQSIELNPQGLLWSWIHRGSSHMSLGQVELALEDLNKASQLNANKSSGAEAEIQQKLGELTTQLGRYDEAIAHFDKSIAITPNAGYRYKRRAVACFHASRFDDALSDLRTARQLDPEDLSTLTWIAPNLLAACPSEDFKTGLLELADKAVEKNPAARSHRAVIAVNLGLFDKAREDMSVVAESDKATYYELYQVALLNLIEPRDEVAYRAACQKMFEGYSESTDPIEISFVGWTCALLPDALDDLNPVEELVQKALDAHPEDPELRRTLGAIQVRLGDFSTAIETLMPLASASETGPEARFSSAYPLYFLALAQFGAEQTDEARQTLDRALESTERELSQNQSLAWNRKLTLELLQKEATETIQPEGR